MLLVQRLHSVFCTTRFSDVAIKKNRSYVQLFLRPSPQILRRCFSHSKIIIRTDYRFHNTSDYTRDDATNVMLTKSRSKQVRTRDVQDNREHVAINMLRLIVN